MTLKLLVVDDEPEVLKVIKTSIESLGYEVLALADSREAAERVGRQKFDGIFVDARMPCLDGPALVRHIRSCPTNNSVPIFMLTGYDDVETMRAGFRAGITFFMGKPLNLKQLDGLLRLMQGPMLKEKRSYVRIPLRTVINCSTGKGQFKAVSRNISEGGMLLEASGSLDTGQKLELRFSLPQIPGLLDLQGSVVRKDSVDRVAVKFMDISPEDQKSIRDFIAGIVK